MRSGEQLDSIMRQIQDEAGDGPPSSLQQARQGILTALAQSTASLRYLLDSKANVSSVSEGMVQSWASIRSALRDQIVTVEFVDIFLRDHHLTSPAHQTLMLRSQVNGSYTGPDLWVPALPWTPLLRDDAAFSHLVSLFLTYVNPFYRFLEEDLFVSGLRSRQDKSRYCSSFLVYAVLASASVRFTYGHPPSGCELPLTMNGSSCTRKGSRLSPCPMIP